MSDAPHIMIVESPYYEEIAEKMIESVLIELQIAGATYERFEVPGTFELPGAIRMAIESNEYPLDQRRFDGYIALGCVIKGQTPHFDLICLSTFNSILNLSITFNKPIGNGIITAHNMKQALQRCKSTIGKKQNKGFEAANAVMSILQNGPKKI